MGAINSTLPVRWDVGGSARALAVILVFAHTRSSVSLQTPAFDTQVKSW